MSAPPVQPLAAVVLPVKPPAAGKSRLGSAGPDRTALAAAFALDTAAAALAAPRVAGVLVVCDDHRFAARLADLGCAVVPDGVAGDLNATLHQGARDAVRRWPATVPVALCADLPALRADDLGAALDAALEAVASGPVFVADAEGTGTTLYAARVEDFRPEFGAGSARNHQVAGALPVPGVLASLRRDVDDAAGLQAAVALGVGPATAALLG